MTNTKFRYSTILAEMKRADETQKDLCKLLGVSIPTINHRLSGKAEWTISEIDALCKHYKMDYYELFRKDQKV